MKISDIEWIDPFSRIEASDPSEHLSTALRNLFALGCYLHLTGEPTAGDKAISTALKATGLHKTDKATFQNILESVGGNEHFYLSKVRANSEINSLFDNT